MNEVQLVVITGISGSGKSVALRALEDVGFFCIDNLPISLFPKLLELCETAVEFTKLALVMDSRESNFFNRYDSEYQNAHSRGFLIRTIFLDASEEVIIRRFTETRRKHPMDKEGDLHKSIVRERRESENLKSLADIVIDTTQLNVHELRELMQETLGPAVKGQPIHLTIMSFGYRYGVPPDANLVFDVRFLANPFFIPELKDQNGLQQAVADFVLSNPITQKFVEQAWNLIEFLLPNYEKEGKHYLVFAFGCTGGVHRSVALAEYFAQKLMGRNCRISLTHRELERLRLQNIPKM